MGSMNISIKDEAYKFLKSLKGKDESFSDVILRFKEKKRNKETLMKLFGGLKDLDIDWEEREKSMKEFRKSFNERIERTAKYMEEARKERKK